MDIIKAIEKENMKETVEQFNIGDTVKVTGRFHDKELVVIGIRNRSKNSKEYDPANGYWQSVIEVVEKAENKTHIDQSLKMVEVK